MTSDPDIHRAAHELIEQHGDAADIDAARRAAALMEAGDLEGGTVWKRIVKAVERLRQREPGDKTVH